MLIVAETPTIGIQKGALRNAIRFVHEWDKRPSFQELKLLGPTFSGSAFSLRQVLDECARDAYCPNVQIITGSANADENESAIVGPAAHRSFAATTHHFSMMLDALKSYLGQISPQWADGNQMALLVENNTAFGSSAAGPGAS